MGCRILDYKTFISFNALEHRGLLNGPFAYKRPILLRFGVFLLCVRRLPPVGPIISELLEKGRLDIRGLRLRISEYARGGEVELGKSSPLTVKVGLSTAELVADSTASLADETISSAPEETEDTTSSASAKTCPRRRAVPHRVVARAAV